MDQVYLIPRYNSPGMWTGSGASTGGGGVSTTEILLGTNAAGVAATFATPAGFWANTSNQTATWTNATTVASADKVFFKVTAWDGDTGFKAAIWNSSGVLQGVSDFLNVTTGMYDIFVSSSISTPIPLTKGQAYRCGWIASSGAQKPYLNTALGVGDLYGNASTYANPGNYTTDTDNLQTPATICMYFTGTTQ